MTLEEELEHVKREYPQAWSHLLGVDPMQPTLPKFDDNDEMYFTQKEERDHAEGIHAGR
jgi:hypothetical protein